MVGRPALFGVAMSGAERNQRHRDRKSYGEEHVAQLERVGRAAQTFIDAVDTLAITYERLEREHGGSKGFAAWLKKNEWDVLDEEDRSALVALGRFKASVELHEMIEASDSPLGAAAIWRWVQGRRKGMKNG